MKNSEIRMTMNGQNLTKEWIENKELERTHHEVPYLNLILIFQLGYLNPQAKR